VPGASADQLASKEKSLHVSEQERDDVQVDCAGWSAEQPALAAENLISLDESGGNTTVFLTFVEQVLLPALHGHPQSVGSGYIISNAPELRRGHSWLRRGGCCGRQVGWRLSAIKPSKSLCELDRAPDRYLMDFYAPLGSR
jgi:hypothetical protein